MTTTEETRRTTDEVARLGREIYTRIVEPQLRPEDDGKFVVLDVDTGDFEVDTSELAALQRLRSRVSGGQAWLERVGSPAAYRIRSSR